jgi:hypothetical protein
MNWPPDTDPGWYMDLYLAHQVILPLLEKNKSDILLWRFHRRSNRDREGRRFTFWFYSTPATAQKIFDDLRSDSIIANCLSDGVIDKILYDDPTNITRPHIKDTSDKSWPVSIQKAWPYYITGVSRMKSLAVLHHRRESDVAESSGGSRRPGPKRPTAGIA